MKKAEFHLPEGMIYLDGNSLGPLPKVAVDRLAGTVTDEWGQLLIKGWNEAGWMVQPSRIGDMIGQLIGCPKRTVAVGDTLSIKVYQALAAALKMRPDRKVILSDSGNFPSDLYMARGLIETLDQGHELRIVAPEDVAQNLTGEVAALLLTQVDYRTGRLHDMEALTRAAHEADVVAIWDLAHSAGAMPIDMAGSGAEFAVGCTYKYLNGGPGAPAFIYTRSDLIDKVKPALSGWLGHEAPFAFDLDYRPGVASERMRVGTPPVLQMAVLEAALGLWSDVSMIEIRERSIKLSELFISEVESRCSQLRLVSPREPTERGSHVSFAFEHGYAVIRALIARNVIGDFRAPDMMRFGFAPLYLDAEDVLEAVENLEQVLADRLWDDPAFRDKALVT